MKRIFYYHANKTHFQKKGFALGLVLRVELGNGSFNYRQHCYAIGLRIHYLRPYYFFFPFLQEKYLLPSPDVSPEKPFPLLNESPPVKTEEEWPSGSSELLIGLTDDNRKLVGYMVPWDPWIYQQLFNPAVGGTEVKK